MSLYIPNFWHESVALQSLITASKCLPLLCPCVIALWEKVPGVTFETAGREALCNLWLSAVTFFSSND